MPNIKTEKSFGVAEVFYSVQFEGPFTGTPAIFIRLSGCNLCCDFCDTSHSTGVLKSIIAIIALVESACPLGVEERPLIVLTGGEPTTQYHLCDLVDTLFSKGYKVQLETNGTIFPKPYNPETLEKMFIVCSPKKGAPLNLPFMQYVDAFKILVDSETRIEDIVVYAFSGKMVYLQPIEKDGLSSEETKSNIKKTLSFAKQLNLNVSIQIHKMIGVK